VGETQVATGAATRVEALLRRVFDDLDVLRDQVVDLGDRARREGRRASSGDLAEIRPTVLDHLAKSAGRLNGTGVITAPGILTDQPRWLEWWSKPGNSTEPRPLAVDLDPHHVGGYDYPAAEWFAVPQLTGHRVIVGPYVDYAGTDEYILTFARPITVVDEFFGVAAADIRATDFEREMLPILDATGTTSLLVNASGRVIASNTPSTIIGSLAPADWPPGRPVPAGAGWADCAGLPWSLLPG
jgi:hypothetical protein